MIGLNRRLLLGLGAVGALELGLGGARAMDFGLAGAPAKSAEPMRLRIGAQASGALGWEIAVARGDGHEGGHEGGHPDGKSFGIERGIGRGLDKKYGLALEVVSLATTEAGKIALIGGAVDLILSDWLFVARQRALGEKLLFARHSSALGAVMAKATTLAGATATSGAAARWTAQQLVGLKLGVAGGSLDKSWLMLQAFALKNGVDLKKQASPVFAAPPLIAEKLANGELDAALEFWPYAARLQGAGFAPVLTMAEVERALGATGPVAATGFVFSEAFAGANGEALRRFLAMMQEAAALTARDDAAFAAIAPMTGVADPATLAILRQNLRDGLIDRPLADDVADAERIFAAIAELGGPALTGGAARLDPALFYDAAQ